MEKPKPDRSESIKVLKARWVKKNASKLKTQLEEKSAGKKAPDKKKQ